MPIFSVVKHRNQGVLLKRQQGGAWWKGGGVLEWRMRRSGMEEEVGRRRHPALTPVRGPAKCGEVISETRSRRT